jgi:hypothetical protein
MLGPIDYWPGCPLYHDMGFIGFLAQGWLTFVDTTIMAPELFARSPVSWMETIASTEATITAAPNFAY